MDISTLFDSCPREEATEAIYFCIRALKQSSLFEEARKEFLQDAKESAPSERAIELAEKVISHIENFERRQLDKFPDELAQQYIDALSDYADRINETSEDDQRRGRDLLEDIRANPK